VSVFTTSGHHAWTVVARNPNVTLPELTAFAGTISSVETAVGGHRL
jgi:hypothetical protein